MAMSAAWPRTLVPTGIWALTSLPGRDCRLQVRHGDPEFGGLLKPAGALPLMEPAEDRPFG
ncbi:hypothetical protein AB0K16_10250 [Nonomuraea jabiensis]|uniref:hypothetical protein n=1 Tax=Nonomuraea jabiensis TaxID=882448 RepID=UPI00343D56B8